MKKKLSRILVCVLTASMLFSLAACGSSSTSDSTSESVSSDSSSDSSDASSSDVTFTASGETLNVGVQSSVISVPVVYAEEMGYYDELGLDVNLIVFANGSSENEGLAASQLDVASNGLASVYSTASGLCSWIGETDSATTTLKIYVSSDSDVLNYVGEIDGKPNMYGSAESLTGLTVLGPTSTIEQWAAAAYFGQFGLEAGVDYEYLNMDKATALQAVISGQGDVFVASDVAYCEQMEEAGFVCVATCEEATDTDFNNGYLARTTVLEERYDDVVLWLQATYRAAAELQADQELRVSYSLEFYTENGISATEESVTEEAELRPYISEEDMTADGYALGSGMLEVANFFASIETIESDQVATVESAINTSVLKDALGITVSAATLD